MLVAVTRTAYSFSNLTLLVSGRLFKLACVLMSSVALSSCAHMNDAPPVVVTQLTPEHILRAAINFGNPILASRDPNTAEPAGVSIDLARELAERLKVSLRLVPFESAGSVVAAGSKGEWDVAFVAVDPVRGKDLLQTAPYVVIEGAYLVKDDSPLTSNDQVDRSGTRVAVAAGSAYDLYLTRELKQATIVRARTSPEVTSYFLSHNLDVAAGVKQQLKADASRTPGLRLLPGRFMEIRQAMATPKGRDAAALYLDAFIEDMKQSGFVARSLEKHHIEGAEVAP